MIASPNRSSRGGRAVRLIVIHTAEGALTTASLGNYFAKTSAQASSHVGIDDRGVEMYVPYDQMSWTVRSGNAISDNAELCGFAAWSRATWLNQHMPMLRLTAGWIRERCLARGIPIRKLTPAQVGAGESGVCGHIDWTLGARDGSHTDPGPGFPWDVVISMAAGNTPAPTPPQEDIMATIAELRALIKDELKLASRNDIGFARDQILTRLGVDDTVSYPDSLPPEELAKIEPARRVDVGFAMDQVIAAVHAVATSIDGIDADSIVAKVKAALAAVEVHLAVQVDEGEPTEAAPAA